jgi:carboxymethylenebutenolidase
MTSPDASLTVQTHDGRRMPAFVARPESGAGPGMVLLQEIFGLTDYIKSRARDLARMGYVVVAPELYWRLGPNVTTDETSESGLQEAFGYFSRLDVPQAVDDAVATLEHVRAMPETHGRAGVLGFCLGGRLAYEVGVRSTPDVVVSYYGSGIADRLEDAPSLQAPVIFHFGGADEYLPPQQVEQIRQRFQERTDAEVHVYPGAGHAFDNFRAPMFHRPDAAQASWPRTVAFLERQFPPNPARA